ncbi:50S ribosomal protein L25/general stress protein Ctc [Bifidobacterium jacchi]|uniref:Large ribosomal subunit protein bL25 n=1 Tax=Bifidobacterium jacchi TaxID=2490545 RepID=A0A5N5RGK3_9BIFI|nr:50S ribosomal protein L25/general stress protein Ctc [Bifidobacterium jacchi]KAB5606397.1 50S ribosomal protein L25/general stress protein Ctc [Bifidobacterium jacchi]
MATTIKLEGEVRNEFGKGVARRMRVANQIPATIYAGGEQPTYVKLPMKETTLALRHTNALFSIAYGDDTKLAVVKDVQRNPVKRIVEHVDFYEVKAGEKIDVEVPVFVEGTPKGAAVAFVDIQEIKVRADVANLPEKIVVNVDGLTDGTKVLLKDVVLPEGAELDMDEPEASVVTVEVPEDATESTAATETAAPAADAAAAAPAADAAAAK